ncbi:MAG: hypothetical protein ACRBCL_06885 [Maritimibacter sp.]
MTLDLMKHLPFITLLILPLLALPVMIIAGTGPLPAGPVLVVSPWGAKAKSNIEMAGGRIIGPETAPFGIFAASDDPQFSTRLRASGAWAVLNGARLAAICGVKT